VSEKFCLWQQIPPHLMEVLKKSAVHDPRVGEGHCLGWGRWEGRQAIMENAGPGTIWER